MVYNYRNRTQINGRDVGIWYGPYTGFTRASAALIDYKVHAGGLNGILYDHDDAGKSDDGASIPASFTTGSPAPLGADVKVRWLTARHFYDAVGAYEIDVYQEGQEIDGSSERLSMDGPGWTWDVSSFDIDYFAGPSQQSEDLNLLGYSPECSLRYSHGIAGEDFTIRRAIMRYKPLGRFTKPKPVDR
jgi:hypothetical protein